MSSWRQSVNVFVRCYQWYQPRLWKKGKQQRYFLFPDERFSPSRTILPPPFWCNYILHDVDLHCFMAFVVRNVRSRLFLVQMWLLFWTNWKLFICWAFEVSLQHLKKVVLNARLCRCCTDAHQDSVTTLAAELGTVVVLGLSLCLKLSRCAIETEKSQRLCRNTRPFSLRCFIATKSCLNMFLEDCSHLSETRSK